MSTYDFSTLYTALPHNLIKDKLIDLIERNFQRGGSPCLARNDRNAFFTSEKPKKYHAWSCQNVCDVLTFLLDNIVIRFGTKLYRQVPEFYGDLVYKFKKIVGSNNFSAQFIEIYFPL